MTGPSQNIPPLVATAEERMRALLAQEKWRQARDELKPLVKVDRVRFLPLLVQANLGLARKMLAGGQAAEARQVVNYLATLVSAEQLRAIELELTVKTGAPEQSISKFVAALTEARDALSEAECVRLADWVVLSFQTVEMGQSPPPARERLAAEVRAVHEALRAVAAARWPEVSELLRLVPHRSVVSHWAVFIKGLAAFHTGGTDKATKLLRSLPAASVPGKAAQAYLLLAAEPTAAPGTPPPPAVVLEGVCRLAGAPGVADILLRADQLWREEDHAESYRVLSEAVPAFPSLGLDWAGALTEFYFKAPHGLGGRLWGRYLLSFSERLKRSQLKNDTETMLANRMISLLGRVIAPADEVRDNWENFLRHHVTIYGPNPRLASLGYGWLGEQLAMPRRSRDSFYGGEQLCDPQGAVETLRRSIELDAGNLAAHLQLGEVYRKLKMNRERNRLLDDMTARFPDDKQVLVQAARGCIDRNSFGKGLDYLACAWQLDRLDPRIPELTLVALRTQARQQFQQRTADRARQTLARTETWLTDKADDLQRSRWAALVRHGVMEQIWGDASQGNTLLAAAAGCAPSRPALWLFAHLAHRIYTKTYSCASPFLAELKPVLRSAPRIGDLGLLLRVFAYWRVAPERLQTPDEERLVAVAIETAVKQPFTRAEAIAVIESARDDPSFSQAITKVVNKVLRADPRDPQFSLWKSGFGVTGALVSHGSRAKLQSILDEAIRRHDEPAMRQARQLLHDLDHPPPIPNPFGLPPDFDDEDDDMMGEDEDDFESEEDSVLPEPTGEMAEMMAMIRFASASEIRSLREKVANEIPGVLFDMMVESVKKGVIPSSPPPHLPPPPRPPRFPKLPQPSPSPAPKPAATPKPARAEPQAPDPNQMEFF